MCGRKGKQFLKMPVRRLNLRVAVAGFIIGLRRAYFPVAPHRPLQSRKLVLALLRKLQKQLPVVLSAQVFGDAARCGRQVT